MASTAERQLPGPLVGAAETTSPLRSLLAGLSRRAARHVCSKPFRMRNRGPLVSFTFDDVPDSACDRGAAILEQFQARGTFYVAAGTCGAQDRHWRVLDRQQVAALHGGGHEIGCHTFSHVNVEKVGPRQLADECRRNRRWLNRLCPGAVVENFCYPYGGVSWQSKRLLQQQFHTCRGIYEGVNVGTIDLGMLRVIELYDRTLTEEKLDRVLATTRDRHGWLIFYTHDVAPQPSAIGCSPGRLRSTLEAVRSRAMPCLPIRDALAEIGYRAPR